MTQTHTRSHFLRTLLNRLTKSCVVERKLLHTINLNKEGKLCSCITSVGNSEVVVSVFRVALSHPIYSTMCVKKKLKKQKLEYIKKIHKASARISAT